MEAPAVAINQCIGIYQQILLLEQFFICPFFNNNDYIEENAIPALLAVLQACNMSN